MTQNKIKLGFIADSSSGLADAPFDHHIRVARSTINFKGKVLLDGKDITNDDFFSQLEQTAEVPSTAAPSTGEIIEQIENLKSQGVNQILYFPISSGLSAYGRNLKIVIDSLELDIDFQVFDAKTACIMQGIVVKYAELLAQSGKDVHEIKLLCSEFIKHIDSYFVVDNLMYLIKNGRLSKLSGTIGTLASIKPVLHLNHEGIIVPFEKIRTQKKAINRILDIVEEHSKKYQDKMFIVLHTNRFELANKVKDQMEESFAKNEKIIISSIVSTVGAHIGSGVIGVVCIGLDHIEVDLLKEI